MCIYCDTNNYRKIYKNHVGSIPIDIDGRTYEIHHIDKNHSNNSPANLIAVTIQEHYNLHYSQKDWGACKAISMRMDKSPEELKFISSEAGKIGGSRARDRVKNGTHHLLKRADGSSVTGDQFKNGTHPFCNTDYHGANNPNFDHRIYKFKNIDTGEEFVSTRYEFMKKFSLEKYSGNITSMIKHNKFNHVKRWTVIIDKFCL